MQTVDIPQIEIAGSGHDVVAVIEGPTEFGQGSGEDVRGEGCAMLQDMVTNEAMNEGIRYIGGEDGG